MTKIDVTLSSEYGIMFLYDSHEKPVFPVDVGLNPVMFTETCLAFSILIHVDGDAEISLIQEISDKILTEYFSGKIDCPSNILSLYDANGFPFASVPLRDAFAQISLRMSEERNPNFVECVIKNMATF